MRRISLAEARRAALAAQGFHHPRPTGEPNAGHIRRVIRRLGLLQLDFVNVLVPAHQFVVFSRLGPYDRDHLHKVVYQGRDFIEHWAHEASIVPVECWPLLKYRRDSYQPWSNSPITKLKGKREYLDRVLTQVQNEGPLASSKLPPMAGPKRNPGDWHRSVPRWALEYHFGHGHVAVANRLPNFQRLYDLPERVIDEPHFSTQLTRDQAQRALLDVSGRALGVASLHDLADYFRMPAREAAPRIAELVEEGVFQEVAVESWSASGYLHKNSRIPRKVEAASLLSPFDPLVWFRPRAEQLFGFHYRIEIYVPAEKRKWGYYVLPFLLNDKIVGRVDLKADRPNRTLRVLASHEEPNVDRAAYADALAGELRSLANWLMLDHIHVARRGTFAATLSARCKHQ